MFCRVEFPPEFFAEVFCLTADALEIIQILRRYLLEHRADMRHGHRREAVLFAGIIQMPEEESHQLAALGEPLPPLRRLRRLLFNIWQNLADGFHFFRSRWVARSV
jgi:hypothetical protein